jgi:uncharacterized protein
MKLIIDGYNLLFAAGMIGTGIGPGSLARSRLALLNFVAESVAEDQRAGVIVVFDARGAPPGLPDRLVHRGVSVRFAPKHQEADELIEELVRIESAPRRLTVVSSDHRLQRAARRRRATAVDSDRWYEASLRRRVRQPPPQAQKPSSPPGVDEVAYWLEKFEDVLADEKLNDDIFPPGYGEDVVE